MSDEKYQALSQRQGQVILGLATGKSIKEISEELSISRRMVDVHLSNARKKTQASTKEQAVAVAVKHQLIAF